MKTSVTFSFLGLFLVVGGFYLYLSPVPPDLPESSPLPTTIQLTPLDEKNPITWMEIQKGQDGEKIVLKQADKDWVITEPVRYPADSLMVESLKGAIAVAAKTKRLLPERPWGEYGLTKPSIRVGMKTQVERAPRYLLLGDLSPVGDYLYARWQDEKEYFLLSAGLKEAFTKSLYALRFKKVFLISKDELTKIHLRLPAGDFEAAKYEQHWFWMQPVPILGDEVGSAVIEKLLTQYEELYVKDFLDAKPPKSDEPDPSLSPYFVKASAGDSNTEVLYLGQELPEQDSIHGFRGEDKVHLLVAKSKLDALFSTVQAAASVKP